jgi:hypothetical protein
MRKAEKIKAVKAKVAEHFLGKITYKELEKEVEKIVDNGDLSVLGGLDNAIRIMDDYGFPTRAYMDEIRRSCMESWKKFYEIHGLPRPTWVE